MKDQENKEDGLFFMYQYCTVMEERLRQKIADLEALNGALELAIKELKGIKNVEEK